MTQGRMQQVRAGVVRPRGRSPFPVNHQLHLLAHLEHALQHFHLVDDQISGLLLGVQHPPLAAGPSHLAGVAGLAAALGIEGCAVKQRQDGLAGLRRGHLSPCGHQTHQFSCRLRQIVTDKRAGAQALANGEPLCRRARLARARPSLPRLIFLTLHRRVETVQVNLDPPVAKRILGKIQREAIGVIELERRLSGQTRTLPQRRGGLIQQHHAASKGTAEPLLLLAQGLDYHRLGTTQFGIGVSHLGGERRHEAVHQQFFGAQEMRMAHGPAHDPAQHIAAALVGRRDPVSHQEAAGAQVVRDHLVREFCLSDGLGLCRLLAG